MKWLKSRDLLPGIIVAVLGILVSLAVVFSNAQGSQQVAAEGAIGVHAEGSLGLAAAVRNQVAQAQVVASAFTVGAASAEEATESLASASFALSVFDSRLRDLVDLLPPEPAQQMQTLAVAFTAESLTVIGAIEDERLDEAAALIDSSLADSYDALAERLVSERDDGLTEMEIAGTSAGRVADVARFLVALIVPLLALLFYWIFIRRRQRRISLEQDLEKARAISHTKDESVASLSHELRTPLTSIYGFAMEMVEMTPEERSQSDELIQIIASESEELSRMVDDLLTAASATAGDVPVVIEDIDPAVEVQVVLAPLLALRAEIPSAVDEAVVRADPLRFRQIVRNLVSNARSHGGPGVSIIGGKAGSVYRLVVVDNGAGVSRDIEERLFKRYVHEGDEPLTAGSIGLGLSIARLLVQRMNGNIYYEHNDGMTAFTVELPLSSSNAGQVAEHAGTAAQA